MNFPKPSLSCSLGMSQRNKGLCRSTARSGRQPRMSMTGMFCSVISMYLCTSRSSSTKPNRSPKASDVMTSSVRYWILRARSTGLKAASSPPGPPKLDRYFVDRSRVKETIWASMLDSSFSLSLPEYYFLRGAVSATNAGMVSGT